MSGTYMAMNTTDQTKLELSSRNKFVQDIDIK